MTNEENEEEIDEAVDKIEAVIDRRVEARLKNQKFKSVNASKLYGEMDLDKAGQFTGDEKIIGFWKALVKNDHVALKALSEGVAADGGYLFPDEFKDELIKDLAEPTRMRGLVRVVKMNKDIMKVPKMGSSPRVFWTSENAVKSTTTASFDQKTLTSYKMASILYCSDELVDDSSLDIVKLVIDLFAEAIAEEEDKVITAGSGVGRPTGLTNCTIASVACSGNLDFDDIINLIYLLPSKYRRNAKFLANDNNIREMRKIKDSQNRYIWQDAVAPGQPATFHGYPVIENNNVPESEIYFGDYKMTYWYGIRHDMRVKVSDVAGNAFERDQTAVRIVHRAAGNCVLENACRKLISIP